VTPTHIPGLPACLTAFGGIVQGQDAGCQQALPPDSLLCRLMCNPPPLAGPQPNRPRLGRPLVIKLCAGWYV